MATTASERSIGDLLKDLTSDLSRLVRSEVALAKAELQENIARLGTGAGLLGGAGVVGLFAVQFILLALMFGLFALGLKLWLAALVVGIVLAIVAGVLAMSGKKKVSAGSLAPTAAIEQMRRDAELIRADIDRVRNH